MSQVILKKYSAADVTAAIADAGMNFSFCEVNGGFISPVDNVQLAEKITSSSRVYGYFNMEFPLEVRCSVKHDDFPGTMIFKFIFNTRINPHSSLANMLALNANKNEWSIDDAGNHISADIKNQLSNWLLGTTSDVPIANLKQYKAAAFLDEDGQKEVARMLPEFLQARYKDLDIEFVGDGGDDIIEIEKRKLREWAKSQGIVPDEADKIISDNVRLEDAKLIMQRTIWATELAKTYEVDIEAIRNLVQKCCSRQEAENAVRVYCDEHIDIGITIDEEEERRKLARWIAENTGITFAAAKDVIVSCPDIPTAKIVAEEYVECHKAAVELKKYGFSILDAKEEINRCGGATQALKLWQTVESLREKYQKYLLMKREEVAAYVEKVGCDKALFEAAQEGQKKKIRMVAVLAGIVVIAAVIAAVLIWAGSLKKDFSIKVVSGNPVQLEKFFNDTFGNSFSYKSSTKTYSVKCTRDEKISFLDMLKSKGFQVEATDVPEEFIIVLADNSMSAYKVDSSAFANNVASLNVIKQFFGAKIYGGTDDIFVGQADAVYQAKNELAAKGISVEIYGNKVVLSPLTETLTISFDADAKADVKNTITRMSMRFNDNGNVIAVAVSGNQKQQIIAALQNNPELGRTKVNSDTAIYVYAKSWNNYSVRFFVKSEADFNNIVSLLSGQKGIKVSGSSYNQNNFGVKIGTVNISSMDNNANVLKQKLFSIVQLGSVNIRERDIKVSVK